jgi:SPP1 gp7 family putative phage head morphogenesis protein
VEGEVRALVDQINQDRDDLEAMGVRAAAKVGRRARVAGIKAWRSGRDPVAPTLEAFGDIRETLTDAMVAAHLRGRRRVVLRAAEKRDQMQRLSVYDAAIAQLQRLAEVRPDQIEALREVYGEDVADTLDQLTDSIDDRIKGVVVEIADEGVGTAEGVRRLRAAYVAAGIEPLANHTLESLFRTQVQFGYSAGRWEASRSPAVNEILWGFEYITVGDDRVRPTHVAMNGTRLPKDHLFWDTHMPPNGWQCRCTVVEIFTGDQEEGRRVEPSPTVVDGAVARPDPDQGFEFNPGTIGGGALPPVRPRELR